MTEYSRLPGQFTWKFAKEALCVIFGAGGLSTFIAILIAFVAWDARALEVMGPVCARGGILVGSVVSIIGLFMGDQAEEKEPTPQELIDRLIVDENIFLQYASLHKVKGTPEGLAKSAANQQHADEIRALVNRFKP